MRLSPHADPEIIDGLYHAINDTFVNDDAYTEMHQYLETIDAEKRNQVLDILNNIMDSSHYIQEYTEEIEQFAALFDQSGNFSNLQCPVIIVHGKDDNTITYKESLALHEQLNQNNVQNTVLITTLIESHSHYKISLETIREFIKLATSISTFFNTSTK